MGREKFNRNNNNYEKNRERVRELGKERYEEKENNTSGNRTLASERHLLVKTTSKNVEPDSTDLDR